MRESLPEEDQVSLIPITALICSLGSHPPPEIPPIKMPVVIVHWPLMTTSVPPFTDSAHNDQKLSIQIITFTQLVNGSTSPTHHFSVYPVINTPSKELWYTLKKTYPLALVNCYNYPCCSRRTISIVWGCNQGGIVAASMKQLSKSGEMFVTDKQAASISWPFCFSLIYNSNNSKISRASAFFFEQQLV